MPLCGLFTKARKRQWLLELEGCYLPREVKLSDLQDYMEIVASIQRWTLDPPNVGDVVTKKVFQLTQMWNRFL